MYCDFLLIKIILNIVCHKFLINICMKNNNVLRIIELCKYYKKIYTETFEK